MKIFSKYTYNVTSGAKIVQNTTEISISKRIMYVNFKGKPERSNIVAVKPHRTSLVPGKKISIK
jgi:hypothetical protein